MHTKSPSEFLFAQPSFVSGMARLLDLGGLFDSYNVSDEADSVALFADWRAVGQDIHDAISDFEPISSSESPKAQYELFASTVR